MLRKLALVLLGAREMDLFVAKNRVVTISSRTLSWGNHGETNCQEGCHERRRGWAYHCEDGSEISYSTLQYSTALEEPMTLLEKGLLETASRGKAPALDCDWLVSFKVSFRSYPSLFGIIVRIQLRSFRNDGRARPREKRRICCCKK